MFAHSSNGRRPLPHGSRLVWQLFVMCIAAALGVAEPCAFAGPQAPSDAIAMAPEPIQHGWMTIRDDRDQSTILLHLPPRIAEGDEPGTVRIAPGVAGHTDAIGYYGSRVWLALAPERGASGTIRKIVTLAAERSIGGSWMYPPGRPEVLAPLPGRDEKLALVGTARGPVALTQARTDDGEGGWALHWLGPTAWHSCSLPWSESSAPSESSIRLVGLGAADIGIAVFPKVGNSVILHRAELPQAQASGEVSLEWETAQWPLDGVGEPRFNPDALVSVGGAGSRQLIATRWQDDSELQVFALRPSGASLLATLNDVPRDHRVSPMHASGTLAVLWWKTTEPAPGAPEPVPGSTAARSFTIAEVSASSGKEIYRGEQRGGSLFTGNEFKAVAIGLLLATTVILLFALRAEPAAKFTLPDGFVFADPVRRLIAGAVDLVPGVVIAAFLLGMEPEAMFSITTFVGPRAQPLVWLLAFGVTAAHCALGESMTGRSIGKSLTGCQVVSMRRKPESDLIELAPIAPWQAIIRNLIRWGIPILGILLFVDGGRRHPADAAAKTIVVVELPPEE
jgi:uncharacterized RDD family membrane protein YckC